MKSRRRCGTRHVPADRSNRLHGGQAEEPYFRAITAQGEGRLRYMSDPVRAGRKNGGRRSWLAQVAISTVLWAASAASDSAAQERLYPDNLFGVALISETSAVTTGYHGAIRLSRDGGRSWTPVASGTDDSLRRVAVAGDGDLFAISHRGRILEGGRNGLDWRQIHEEPGLQLRDVAFADAKNGFVTAHDGVILHTDDGGRNWKRQTLSNYTGRDLPRLNGVAVIDPSQAIVVGEFGVVAATNDGGDTWKVISQQIYPTLLQVAVAGDRGLAVGLNGTLLTLSRAAGGEWSVTPIDTGTSQHLLSVALSSEGGYGLIGGNGLLLTLTAEGLKPAMVAPDYPLGYSWLGGVAIGKDGRAIAVGLGGAILRADSPDGLFTLATTGRPTAASLTNDSERVTQ